MGAEARVHLHAFLAHPPQDPATVLKPTVVKQGGVSF